MSVRVSRNRRNAHRPTHEKAFRDRIALWCLMLELFDQLAELARTGDVLTEHHSTRLLNNLEWIEGALWDGRPKIRRSGA